MKDILFICTHNSARSQMAEGLVNALYPDRFRAFSAGTERSTVKPFAIEALKRMGIDISHHRSKSIEEFKGRLFDIVVTVCDHARETCPFFPGKKVIHRSFTDPSNVKGTDEEKLNAFIKVRDEIRYWFEKDILEMETGSEVRD